MPTTTPRRIGAYHVVRALAAHKSFLAEDEAGRRVILKLLDPDCLLDEELHPRIYDRLSRIRELAQQNVASLYGVERDADLVYMVWEFVDAAPFSDYAAAPNLSERDLLSLMRELALAIESMHARGIVHGELHSGNVLVDRDGKVRLIDLSPLLYHDPAVDERALIQLLREAARRRGALSGSITQALDALDERHTTIRELTYRLAALAKPDDPARHAIEDRPLRLRIRTLVFAFAVALLGVAMFFVVRAYVQRQIHDRTPKQVMPSKP